MHFINFLPNSLLPSRTALAFILLILSPVSLAKSASLIEIDSFGSDPYKNLAQSGDYFIATGTDSNGGSDSSPVIDLVHYENSTFAHIETVNLNKLLTTTSDLVVKDVISINGYFVILAMAGSDLHFVVADVVEGKFNQVSELALGYGTTTATLLKGEGNHLYLVDRYGTDLVVKHLSLDDEAVLKQQSSRTFGEISQNYPTYEDWFAAGINANHLIVAINDKGNKATFYQLPLDNQGVLEAPVVLSFENAKDEYNNILIQGDSLYLSYVSSGFQVTQLTGNSISLLQGVDVSSINSFSMLAAGLLVAKSPFYLYLYDVSDSNNISLLTSYDPENFVGDMVVSDGQIYVTRKSSGIEAININDENAFVSVASDAYSGAVTDFTVKGETLVSSANTRSLNVWQFSDTEQTSLVKRFSTESTNGSLTGVEFQEDNLLVMNESRVEKHSFDNIILGLDDGNVFGSTNVSASTGELITLPNGFLSRIGTQLDFFDSNLTQRGQLKIENPNYQSQFVQTPIAYTNYLFVRINTNPSQIVVYDISDLSAVSEISRITLTGGTIGNLLVKDDKLIASEYADWKIYISMFDLSDMDNISKLSSIELDTFYKSVSLHLYQDYLVVVADKAWLYDISDISAPVLIDENGDLSSNGISTSKDKNIFNVIKDSGGHIQRSMINMAPSHEDLIINSHEDLAVETPLAALDEENDAVSFEVLNEPKKGLLEILENETIKFTPSLNVNGADQATLMVKDVHGGSQEFTVTYEILAVNDTPTIVATTLVTNEDNNLDALIEAQDVDGDELVFEIITEPESGTATISEEGQLTYQPNGDFYGSDLVEIKVTDPGDATASAEFVINVNPVNDAPVITSTRFDAREDEVLSNQLSATDVENHSVSYSLVEGSVQNGEAVVEQNGSFVFTPVQDYFGEASFAVVALDSEQGSTEQLITISVEAVEDMPVTENSSATVAYSGSVSNALTASDADGDSLTFSLVEDVKNGNLTLSSDGNYTYQANATFSGTDSFTYQVTDTNDNSVQATVTLNVQAKPIEQESSSSSGGGSMHYVYLILMTLVFGYRRMAAKTST